MRTAKKLSPLRSQVYVCELEHCPVCDSVLSRCNYRSGAKTVQELDGVHRVIYQPKCCLNPHCGDPEPNSDQRIPGSVFVSSAILALACLS